MDKAIKDRWVAALRSGEYEQGVGALSYVDTDEKRKWCCLGVLCDLAQKEGVVTSQVSEFRPWTADPEHDQFLGFGTVNDGYDMETSALPLEVVNWAKTEVPNPVVVHLGVTASLAEFNDGRDDSGGLPPIEPMNFNQIADLIEASL